MSDEVSVCCVLHEESDAPLDPDPVEVERRGTRMSVKAPMLAREFRDRLRKMHGRSVPMVLYSIRQGFFCDHPEVRTWGLCDTVGSEHSYLAAQISGDDEMDPKKLEAIESELEERVENAELCNQESHERAVANKARLKELYKFEVVIVINMPAHDLLNWPLEALNRSETWQSIDFEEVPNVEGLKAAFRERSETARKSWPLYYYNHKHCKWTPLALDSLPKEMKLDELEGCVNKRLELLFCCPANLFTVAVDPDPWQPPRPEDLF